MAVATTLLQCCSHSIAISQQRYTAVAGQRVPKLPVYRCQPRNQTQCAKLTAHNADLVPPSMFSTTNMLARMAAMTFSTLQLAAAGMRFSNSWQVPY